VRAPFARRTMVRVWRTLGLLLLGAVIGASFATLRLAREMDRIVLDNASLMDEVERLAGELASRERALTASQRAPVRSVVVEVETPLLEHIRLHVEEEAHDLLAHLIGEEIDSLNPSLIEKALHRTLHVDKQDFVISPTLIVVASTLRVRLKVQEGRVEVAP